MSNPYMEKKMSQCMAFLDAYGIDYDSEVARGDMVYAEGELMSFRLAGQLSSFDVAFMNTGVVSLREIDDNDESRDVVLEQGSSELIADFINDLKKGKVCSHL